MHYPIFVKKKRKRIEKKRTKVVKHKKNLPAGNPADRKKKGKTNDI